MIRKIVSIKKVGRFLDYSATGDVELKRYNLIFAENGRGKTTLCAILRSLQSGEPALILGRTTLGIGGSPEVKILLDQGIATFANSKWDVKLPAIAVFDSSFVSENVYSGESVGLDHKRRLYKVIIGKQGVDLARRIEGLDAVGRSKNPVIREKRAAVQGFVPEDFSLEAFLKIQPDPEVDSRIAEKETELRAVEATDQIAKHATLAELILPDLPSRFRSLLSRTIDGIASDAERCVVDHIARHAMGNAGEKWLSEGLGYIRNNRCPFCEQDLDGARSLIASYNAYFSQAYDELRSEVMTLANEVAEAFGDRVIAAIGRTLDHNAALAEFWSGYCKFAAPKLAGAGGGIEQALRQMAEAAHSLLEGKGARLLEVVSPDSGYETAARALAALIADVKLYNLAVRAANETILAKKASVAGADPNYVRAALSRHRAAKKRYEPDVSTACHEYEVAVLEKQALDEEKENAKRELDEYSMRLMEEYEHTINGFLDDVDAGFRVTATKHGYPGGVACCSYQILINETAVELGDEGTPADRPSFRNTLSSGDKSTLGLAFFLAVLTHDPGKSGRIVIFDDPFNSQDGFRKNWTAQKIKEWGGRCAQVLVLSHDERFLGLIWDRLAHLPSERKALRFGRVGIRNTTVSGWDIEKATQSQFFADQKALVDYYRGAEDKPCDVVRKIRPVLETYFRNSYPDEITQDDCLGEIIAKIRTAGAAHILAEVLDDLESLNAYTTPYVHGQPGAVTATIDDNELHSFVKKALSLVGGC